MPLKAEALKIDGKANHLLSIQFQFPLWEGQTVRNKSEDLPVSPLELSGEKQNGYLSFLCDSFLFLSPPATPFSYRYH
jgi:hypothetical protein